EVRRQVVQLAGFFGVPGRSANATIQTALLKALADPDPGVRSAAIKVVGDLSLRGVEADEQRLHAVLDVLRDIRNDPAIIVRALARNPALVARPEVVADLKSLLARDDAAIVLQPVLGAPAFTDAEVLAALSRGWDRAKDPKERLGLLEVLFARKGMLDVEEPA